MNSDAVFVTDGLTRHFGAVVAVDHLTWRSGQGKCSASWATTAPARLRRSGC